MGMRKTKSKPATSHSQRQLRKQYEAPQKLAFIAHVHELRKRLSYIAVAVGLGASLAYSAQETLTRWLLQPSSGQQFIYTTPGGGFDFQFKLCLYTGIALSIPVIVYNIFKYLHPLLKNESKRFVGWLMFSSATLALLGISFGYFFGLPAAMHFLLQSFSSARIEALITIQSYMSFVMVYLLGAALLFQIPLILLLTNRIKPLQPKKLMQHQRWFVIGAFVLGAIISPTPDIRNQLVLTGPIIIMYELSVVLIWIINRGRRKPRKVVELLHKDTEAQSERLASFEKARSQWRQTVQSAHPAPDRPASSLTISSQSIRRTPSLDTTPTATLRPQKYVQDFSRQSRPISPGTTKNQPGLST
jgi:sec-independent protein translocase protein TatC